jgi:hypothetical protein
MSVTLYVFMHGLFVVSERVNGSGQTVMDIALPDVPGHVYRAGTWIEEQDIASGAQLILNGVVAGNQSFKGSPNVVELAPGCSLSGQKQVALLTVPQPDEILALLLAQDPALVTSPTPRAFVGGGAAVTSVGTIHVLVYHTADETKLSIQNHPWEPVNVGGAVSLHLISTSAGPEGTDHDADTENALINVINNYPQLKYAKPPATLPPNWNEAILNPPSGPPNPLYGDLKGRVAVDDPTGEYILQPIPGGGFAFAFSQAEVEGIPRRTVRLGRLGRMKMQGVSTDDLWETLPDPLGEVPCNCGPIIL